MNGCGIYGLIEIQTDDSRAVAVRQTESRQSDPPGANISRTGSFSNRELLNAMVERINDINVVCVVDGEGVRGLELSRIAAAAAPQGLQVGSLGGELLYAPAHRADPQEPLPVETDPNRPLEA